MNIDLDFVSDPTPPADAWATLAACGHDPMTMDLDALTAQFLNAGGRIAVVPPGATAYPTGPQAFNPSFIQAHQVSAETIAAREAHNQRVTAKLNAKYYAADGALVEKLRPMVERECPRGDILFALDVSNDKFQRLLRTYLADEPKADPYRQLQRDARESLNNPRDTAVAEQLKYLFEKGATLAQAVKHTGHSLHVVYRIIKKYKLTVKARRARGELVLV